MGRENGSISIMFQKVYQGGSHIEVFSSQGKPTSSQCKFYGPQASIKKEFDKDTKSYLYHFEGDSTVTKLQLPKGDKQTLHLLQPYCIFQLNVPSGASIAIDLCIGDAGNNRRRILLSSSQREPSTSPLHARVPLTLPRDQWNNLCMDMNSLVTGLFKGQTFKTLDKIIIGGTFRLRKIFTMRSCPPASEGYQVDDTAHIDIIPKPCQMSSSLSVLTQVVTYRSVVASNGVPQPAASQSGSRVLLAGERQESAKPRHIAFGKKVDIPDHVLKQKQRSECSLSHPSQRIITSSGGTIDESDSCLSGQNIQPRPPKAPPPQTSTAGRNSKKIHGRTRVTATSSMKKITDTPSQLSSSTMEVVSATDKKLTTDSRVYRAEKYMDDTLPTTTDYLTIDDKENTPGTDDEVVNTSKQEVKNDSLFTFSSPPKQSSLPLSPVPHDAPVEVLGSDMSVDVERTARRENYDEDFVSSVSDISQEQQSSVLPSPVSKVVSKADHSPERSAGLPASHKEGLQSVSIPNVRLSEIYDWRQYESKDGENVIPGPSISTRMKAILNRDVTGESGTFELDSSPTNTSSLTISWNDRLRNFVTPNPTLDLRESDILSPPVTLTYPDAPQEEPPQTGWSKPHKEQAPNSEDELELLYDSTLGCFYDPKTCKYYVLTNH